jgi:hypothetical protein
MRHIGNVNAENTVALRIGVDAQGIVIIAGIDRIASKDELVAQIKALAGLACGRLQACGFVRYFEAQSVAIDTYGLEAERDGIYSDEVKNISVSIEKGRFEMIVP